MQLLFVLDFMSGINHEYHFIVMKEYLNKYKHFRVDNKINIKRSADFAKRSAKCLIILPIILPIGPCGLFWCNDVSPPQGMVCIAFYQVVMLGPLRDCAFLEFRSRLGSDRNPRVEIPFRNIF